MDEAHGAWPSERVATWLTPRDILNHLVRDESSKELEFIILITVLAKKARRRFWETGDDKIDRELKEKKNYYDVFHKDWIELKNEIEKKKKCSLLIINEDGIEIK